MSGRHVWCQTGTCDVRQGRVMLDRDVCCQTVICDIRQGFVVSDRDVSCPRRSGVSGKDV